MQPNINEKLKARPIAMAQSILCSGMIFHCILGTNCMDNSPSWKLICICNFCHPCSASTQCCTLFC
uniref:Appr-1-p processing enzyme family protein n=1 Tax=Rhizophora mucronata TaxID=61149 RepID=A0A2P2M6R4_RHIMU